MCMCAAFAGATGLVGSRLVAKLAAGGHSVRVLTRDVGRARGKLPYGRLQFYGQSEWASAIDGATAVVNLAGQQLSCPHFPLISFRLDGAGVGCQQPVISCFVSCLGHEAHIKSTRVAAFTTNNWDARPIGILLVGLQNYAPVCSSRAATRVMTPTGGCACSG